MTNKEIEKVLLPFIEKDRSFWGSNSFILIQFLSEREFKDYRFIFSGASSANGKNYQKLLAVYTDSTRKEVKSLPELFDKGLIKIKELTEFLKPVLEETGSHPTTPKEFGGFLISQIKDRDAITQGNSYYLHGLSVDYPEFFKFSDDSPKYESDLMEIN